MAMSYYSGMKKTGWLSVIFGIPRRKIWRSGGISYCARSAAESLGEVTRIYVERLFVRLL